MKILAVTACPTGMVCTYMSAEAIEQACKKLGVECKVETQGALGIENEITDNDLEEVKVVILTTDMPIKNEERFKELMIIKTTVNEAIKEADNIIAKAIAMIK